MKLMDFVVPAAVVPRLASPLRDGVIAELARQLASAEALGAGDVEDIIDALIQRENAGTTGFGKGVAVPHAKHAKVPRLMTAIGVAEPGVDFKARDGLPVNLVFVVLSPEGHNQQHLEAMNAIFTAIQMKENFRHSLRKAGTKEAMLQVLTGAGQ